MHIESITMAQVNQQSQQYHIGILKFNLLANLQFTVQYWLHSLWCCYIMVFLPPVQQLWPLTCLPNTVIHQVTVFSFCKDVDFNFFFYNFLFLRLKYYNPSPFSFLLPNCSIYSSMLSLEFMLSFSINCYCIHILFYMHIYS